MRFKKFVPLDAGGQLTLALSGGVVDVALVFSADPTVAQRGLRLLEDDRGWSGRECDADGVGPARQRYGERLTGASTWVSARLTTEALIGLNGSVPGRAAPR